jgi:hypothetical protein
MTIQQWNENRQEKHLLRTWRTWKACCFVNILRKTVSCTLKWPLPLSVLFTRKYVQKIFIVVGFVTKTLEQKKYNTIKYITPWGRMNNCCTHEFESHKHNVEWIKTDTHKYWIIHYKKIKNIHLFLLSYLISPIFYLKVCLSF